MIAILSPAKTLDFETPVPLAVHTVPLFIEQTTALANQIRQLPPADIASLMGISPALALLNVERFASWQAEHNIHNSRQAIFAYHGEVYRGLQAYALAPEALHFSTDHLRIISGFYGVLRPFDLIQPYRLEMGVSFRPGDYPDLYSCWKPVVTAHLREALAASPAPYLINLASNEYFRAVDTKQLHAPVITPVFKETTPQGYKTIAVYAKKARGMMVRFMLENQLTTPDDLKAFDSDGYHFDSRQSSDYQWVFVR